jgi:class 3 adenylate cyclase/tetratricopeptide (TPR) repeat protein
MAPAPATPTEERKVVTVVFTDIVGSTARAEQLDPEDVAAMLSPYYARLRGELERFGGTVEKFIGDAVVALFGAPVAHEDDPERAVRAALAIRDAVADLNEAESWLDLHIRTGVNTGEALVTVDARPSEGEGIAAGDVMNTAARLQSAAPTDGIVVGEDTYRATVHAIDYRPAEPIKAKGKAELVSLWEVLGTKEAAPAARRTSAAPLVGREADLASLEELWDQVGQTRSQRLGLVVGAPGIGKSRLIAEFADRRRDDAIVYQSRCLAYGEGITYWPVLEMIKDAAGVVQDDDTAATSEKLAALLDGLGTNDQDELRTMAAAVASLTGVESTPRGTYAVGEISQAELHWGIRRVLQLEAAERPLVLVFEDLHWAEPTLIELIRYLTAEDRSNGGTPILVLASTRPELADSEPAFVSGDGNRRVIELAALADRESERLVEELLASSTAPEASVDVLLRTAGGNPLFIEELARILIDTGRLEAVPSSLQALIGSRLDELPSLEKRLAQHAAVVGDTFWPGAVAHLAEANGEVALALESLERRDLVRAHEASTVAGEREYSFKHIVIRDVAYGQLPKGRRAGLHVRCADWTEALPRAEGELVEIVAYHLEQACLLAREVVYNPVPPPVERAAAVLVRAAEKAERREGTREADRFYARALELFNEHHPEAAAEVRLRRGRILVAQGDLRHAKERLAEVAEEALAIGRRDLRCSALIALANVDFKQARAAEARAFLTEAQSIASELGDHLLQIRAGYESANLRAWFEGEDQAAVDEFRRTLAIAEELDSLTLRVEGHMRLGFLFFNLGSLAEAERDLARSAELAGEVGSYRDEARATFLLGVVRYYRGDLVEAERLALRAAEWLERTGESFFQVQNLRALAMYALARGEARVAEARLREAVPLALESETLVLEVYRLLTQALLQQGRLDEARELAEFAARNVPAEDLYGRTAVLLAEASVAAADGERVEAESRFAEAFDLLEQQHLHLDLGEARLAFARVLRGFGESSRARDELTRARGLVDSLGAAALVEEIDRELAELEREAGEAGPPLSA